MSDDETPIAWLALKRGVPVFASDGEEVGHVSTVIADEQKDIFSGVAFRDHLLSHERFAPAAVIDTLTTRGVHLSIDKSAAIDLGNPPG
ncbi:MAG: hypothetical protein QOF16_96 [Actinomycetota bacterium]|jgi:uncharacterized protein YrrD|nr:hypothetical protein [Actinomycetota bacterium]MEA2486442.1 hypothetical protein [Actinomycetota bacterium]